MMKFNYYSPCVWLYLHQRITMQYYYLFTALERKVDNIMCGVPLWRF